MKEAIAIIGILLLVLSAGCISQPEIANPASEFCIENGGTLEIVTDEDGSQRGVCTLSSGEKCDEWEYYNGECGANVGIANPAAVFCIENGGTLEMETDESGGQYGICVLPSGERCEEWAYFRGECGSSANTSGASPMTQELCELGGGHFNACASACRNDPDAEVCIQVCVQECECGGEGGFTCPAGYYCTDYVPAGAQDATGVCRPE